MCRISVIYRHEGNEGCIAMTMTMTANNDNDNHAGKPTFYEHTILILNDIFSL